MATTYTPIATNTVSGSSTTTVTFSSISSAYTDLILVMQIADTTANANAGIVLNSDTGTNYSRTQILGNGTTATSSRTASMAYLGITPTIGTSTNFETNIILHFMNYSNTTTYKTVLARGNQPSVATIAQALLWRSTAAITRMDINDLGTAWKAGSTFTLYGIRSA